MEARDINANSMPPPPHQSDEVDPDVLLGADRGTSPTPVNLTLLDSTLESRGSQSVDEIQSDFSSLTVSHDTSGLATTGVQEGQSSRYCKGKHPPSNRFKHSHSHEDRPTAVISPMQSVEPLLEADRVELTLPAVHNLSSTEEEEDPGVGPVELISRVVRANDIVTVASSDEANTTVDISSDSGIDEMLAQDWVIIRWRGHP